MSNYYSSGWAATILLNYGITVEDVAYFWDQQKGLCPICEEKLGARTWVVEHDHKTGVVRGLTCWWCNFYVIPAAELALRHRHRMENAFKYLGAA